MHHICTLLALLATFVSSLRALSPHDPPTPRLPRRSEHTLSLQDHEELENKELRRRATSPIDVCLRWAQQSAVVNGTLYLYGGEATTEPSQTYNTWNNNFLSLDLTKSWQISSPALTGLPQPSGPPNVSLGYLWNSYDSLFLYGGEFEWKSTHGTIEPPPFALWEYDISSQSWLEHNDPTTSSGASAPSNGQPVQRAAEGAGVSVPSLGRGFYFGGHLDAYTTPGWSVTIPRVYLQSLLEYTFPGHRNTQVSSLSGGELAGPNGAYRNITQGGSQAQVGFTARADGLLIYVPGFGDEGILLALAGGTNQTFTQMNNINVYDIATSTWYTQSTSGQTPEIRVNPCAVIAAAPDGSSYNIYMFGGQNLVPYGQQTQYDDMWILSVPSFTWIKVDQSGQSVPYARSGATCNIWDGQMVMVGGYVGSQLSCESPGVYVFNLSSLQWVNQFTALNAGTDNPLNQQPAQLFNASDAGGLAGSFGYQIPDAVYSVIGGGPTGGATLTAPVATATSGPLASGRAQTYSVTSSAFPTATDTSGGSSSSTVPTQDGVPSNSPRVAAIAVGVIAGILLLVAGYLAFCAYVYRKQLQLYKRHVEMAQRAARSDDIEDKAPSSAWGAALLEPSSGVGGDSNSAWRASNLRPTMTNTYSASAAIKTGSHVSKTERHSGTTGDSHEDDLSYRSSGTGAGEAMVGLGYQNVRRNSRGSSVEGILASHEPSFVGVMLHPRRSLRVINRD